MCIFSSYEHINKCRFSSGVEQLICNQWVGGSNPSSGTITFHFLKIPLMLKVDCLKNHPHFVSILARWAFDAWGMYNPDATFETTQQKLTIHLNDHCLPLTLIAVRNNVPIGMVSLRVSDGCDHLGAGFTPWLGSLFVIEQERSKGIAALLIREILQKAKNLGFLQCYLLTFEKDLVKYYESLGWDYLQDDLYYFHPVTLMKIKT